MRFIDRGPQNEPKAFQSLDFEVERDRIRELIFSADGKMRSQRRMPYNQRLLDHPSPVEGVEQVFGRVCAYCETPFKHGEIPRLDHHRPRNNAAGSAIVDGHLYYAWLSYEWDNILPVCSRCNRHKRDRFPIEKNQYGTLGASVVELRESEPALLLDPCFDDLAEHLEFSTTGRATALTNRGEVTIDLLALNSSDIFGQRSKSFAAVANDIVNRPEAYEIIPTGWPNGWSSHIIDFKHGIMGFAGGFSLALLKLCEADFWDSNQFAPFLGGTRERAANSSELAEILDALNRMPEEYRRDLLEPFWSDSSVSLDPGKEAMVSHARQEPRSKSRIISLADLAAARMPIQNVDIASFKALRSVKFTLPERVENPNLVPCMLILGENATGKSSVLEAIGLTLLGTSEIARLNDLLKYEDVSPEEFVHRPDVDDWDRLSEDPLEVRVSFFSSKKDATLIATPGAEDFSGDKRPSKIALAYGPRRFFAKRKSRRFRAPAYRVKSLFDPMEVIANPIDWLLDLKDEARFDAAVRALRVVLMLEPDAKILREDGRILIDTPQGQTPLSKLSVGYKSIVGLAVDIIREMFYHYPNLEEAYAVVIIDEIETHLHPRWKMRIVSLLREAFPKIQFVMTTHDPLCLRGMYQGEVFVLQRRSEDARIESLEELPDVQGMRADQILTSEFFGLGSTDPSTDAKLIRYHHLTRLPEPTSEQEEERKRLAREIEDQMVVGSTMEEQVEARAMVELTKEENFDDMPAPKIDRADRKEMLARAMEKLQSGRAEQ